MSKLLGPIVKRMRQLGRDTTNTIQEFIGLDKGIEAIGASADDFDADINKLQQHVMDLSERWLRMYTEIQVLRAKKQEITSLPSIADRLADAIQILELQDEVMDVDYIQLARCILHTAPAQFGPAVKEVSSFIGGPEQLSALFIAIEMAMKLNSEE